MAKTPCKLHVIDNDDFIILSFGKIPEDMPESRPCADSGKPCLRIDQYMVWDSVWVAAGLKDWDSGHIHRECLEKRLGRNVKTSDLLWWSTPDGAGCYVRPKDVPRLPEIMKPDGKRVPS